MHLGGYLFGAPMVFPVASTVMTMTAYAYSLTRTAFTIVRRHDVLLFHMVRSHFIEIVPFACCASCALSFAAVLALRCFMRSKMSPWSQHRHRGPGARRRACHADTNNLRTNTSLGKRHTKAQHPVN